MTVVFEQVLMLVLFAAAGYVLCKKHLSDSKHTKLLSTLEIYVFLPGTVFNTFSKNFTVAYLREKYVLVLISAAVLVIVAVSMHFFSKVLTKDDYRRSVYTYSLSIPNYGYMGYALAGSLFGSETLLNVMIYALPLSMYVYTIGYCMLTKTKLNLKKLLNPVLISMGIGMVVGLVGWQPPALVSTMAEKAAACMAPVSMLLTGMVISEYRFRELLRNKMNYLVSGLRLVVDTRNPEGQRLVSLCLADGSPVDDDRLYTVATTDYIALGGNDYKGITDRVDWENTHVRTHKFFVDFLRDMGEMPHETDGRMKNLDENW